MKSFARFLLFFGILFVGTAFGCEQRESQQSDFKLAALQASVDEICKKVQAVFIGQTGKPFHIRCDIDMEKQAVSFKMNSGDSSDKTGEANDFAAGIVSAWDYGVHPLECGCYIVDDWVAAHLLKICAGYDKLSSHYDLIDVIYNLLNHLVKMKALMSAKTYGKIDKNSLRDEMIAPNNEDEVNRQLQILKLVEQYNQFVDKLNKDHNHPFAREHHLTYFN